MNRGRKTTVYISYFGVLRAVAGRASDEIVVDEGTSVRELLNLLAERNGERFKAYIQSEQGTLKGGLNILLDGQNVDHESGLNTGLKPGSRVTLAIILAMEGG